MGVDAPLAVFRPAAKNRALGLLVYGLGGTVISIAVGFLGGLFAGALLHLAVGELPSLVGGFVVGLAVLILLVRFFIRGYRRQAGSEIRLWPDRLERVTGEKVETIRFDALAAIEHHETPQPDLGRIVLRPEEGKVVEVTAPWSLAEVGPRLKEIAVPVMVARRRAALDRGEELVFREQQGKALWSALGGLLSLGWGGFLTIGIALAMSRGETQVEPRGLTVGIMFLIAGFSSLTWFIRTRGNGMILTRTGIRKIGRDFGSENPWTDVRRLTLDKMGVRLEGEVLERPYRLSRRAPNFLVLVPLVAELAPDLEGVPR